MKNLTQEKRNHLRHKCSICGRVRYEQFMALILSKYGNESALKTRYGHKCWYCVANPDCRQKANNFYPY